MLNTTVPLLKCPSLWQDSTPCQGALELSAKDALPGPTPQVVEVRSGRLRCVTCQSTFPILAGVALLVDDVGTYLTSHVKGIAQLVSDLDIPKEYLPAYMQAKGEIEPEHIEEDLESERVTSLYLINHYLHASRTFGGDSSNWWKPLSGKGSPVIDALIREHWDNGPFAQIERWVAELSKSTAMPDTVELGCGLGGLYPRLRARLQSYLGVDSSFASIALARHLALGVPYNKELRIPEDLIHGPVSRRVQLPPAPPMDGRADFVVGELDRLPVQPSRWDLSLALNAIDMLEDPSLLPKTQRHLLKQGGYAIQSCPYVWHEGVAELLRESVPSSVQRSAEAVEYLYSQSGFEIQNTIEHLPWLFFKHLRQLEIYSVHLFTARVK